MTDIHWTRTDGGAYLSGVGLIRRRGGAWELIMHPHAVRFGVQEHRADSLKEAKARAREIMGGLPDDYMALLHTISQQQAEIERLRELTKETA